MARVAGLFRPGIPANAHVSVLSFSWAVLPKSRAAAFLDLLMGVLIRRSGDKLFSMMTFCRARGFASSGVSPFK